MTVEEAIKELKRLTADLEEIAKTEPWVKVNFDVEEYWIEKFGTVNLADYGDLRYYFIDCDVYV